MRCLGQVGNENDDSCGRLFLFLGLLRKRLFFARNILIMVQATFTISSTDFTDEIIEKIRDYLKGQRALVTINIQSEPGASAPKQTREEYFAQLDRALADIDRGEPLVSFSLEEFQAFVHPTSN